MNHGLLHSSGFTETNHRKQRNNFNLSRVNICSFTRISRNIRQISHHFLTFREVEDEIAAREGDFSSTRTPFYPPPLFPPTPDFPFPFKIGAFCASRERGGGKGGYKSSLPFFLPLRILYTSLEELPRLGISPPHFAVFFHVPFVRCVLCTLA